MEVRNVQQILQEKINEIQNRIPVRLGVLPSFQAVLGERLMPSAPTAQPGGVSAFDGLIREAAEAQGMDPALIKAVIDAESSFNPDAVSSAGAMGLMQLMPGTAEALGVSDAFDPRQNILGGTRYLKGLLDRFDNDPKLALAAYNAGPGRVKQYGGIPPFTETQTYVSRVLEKWAAYRAG